MKFEPLSSENIDEAIVAARSVFSGEKGSDDDPAKAYSASVYPDKHRDDWERYPDKTIEYWVVREEGEIIGGTGLYSRTIDSDDIVWLGWFFVTSSGRGRGFGRKILEWSRSTAKERGYRTMRLYTSTDPNEAVAQKLYESVGLKVTSEEDDPNSEYKKVYREGKL